MRQVSDAFLLNLAEVSATLIGLFMVGVFFYVETGFQRLHRAREVMERYFRAGTRIVLVLYAIPLGLSLSLVALTPAWSKGLFLVLSVALLASNVDSVRRMWAVARVTGPTTYLLANEVVGSIGVVVLVSLPWILGGLHPTREDLTWALLVAFATGFISIITTVMSVFDTARLERGGAAQSGAGDR